VQTYRFFGVLSNHSAAKIEKSIIHSRARHKKERIKRMQNIARGIKYGLP
jgi:hypothetical protein